jgi:HK97 family phage portal protein
LILSKIKEHRSEKFDPIHPRDSALAKLYRFFGGSSDTGIHIDADNAPETVAVMACVRVISETLASLPFLLYRRLEDDGKERASDHPLYEILRYQPNPWQSWYEFAEMMTAHACLRHGGCAKIVSDAKGKVTALIPLNPDRVQPLMVKGVRIFSYQPMSGEREVLLPGEMLYIPSLSFDGVSGIDPITYVRNAVGLARATEKFGAKFFANDARPGVIFKHPGPKGLGDVAYKNLKESIEARHKGVNNSHKSMILEEGMDVKEIGVSPENAQFLETRKYQKSEIAGFFRVPPHMIGDLDKATFSNIEHQSRAFVDYTMLPWFTRWEQAIRRDILTPNERKEYFAEFLPDALLRGDLKSRYEAFAIAKNWGFLSTNEIRVKENMNKVKGGDTYLQPLNMTDSASPAVGKKTETNSLLPVLDAAAERISRKETKALRNLLEKRASEENIQDFYKDFSVFVRDILGVNEEIAEQYCRNQCNKFSEATDKDALIEEMHSDKGARVRIFLLDQI